jgi:hypothetical protein
VVLAAKHRHESGSAGAAGQEAGEELA